MTCLCIALLLKFQILFSTPLPRCISIMAPRQMRKSVEVSCPFISNPETTVRIELPRFGVSATLHMEPPDERNPDDVQEMMQLVRGMAPVVEFLNDSKFEWTVHMIRINDDPLTYQADLVQDPAKKPKKVKKVMKKAVMKKKSMKKAMKSGVLAKSKKHVMKVMKKSLKKVIKKSLK